MSGADGWIRDKLAEAPAELIATMLEVLPAEQEMSIAEALAVGASTLYRRVMQGSGGREDALPLLAADALLTHAFQAQVETDPAALRAFAARWQVPSAPRTAT